ncbi:hypothetical protein [Baaleninema simplex]|uniref:hypothetical protein n=1 Tax=Baaleninema simplex TaxID=2862350 RepID=UPI00034C8401|nr:hypothetical protein [Baaleninema simplex]
MNSIELCQQLRESFFEAINIEKNKGHVPIREIKEEMEVNGKAFMFNIFKLGQSMTLGIIDPEDAPIKQLLSEINDQLPLIELSIDFFLDRATDPSQYDWQIYSQYEQVKYACWAVSALHFLNELFPNPGNEKLYWEPIDIEEVEKDVAFWLNRVGSVRPNDIPPGIPSSHWWWWSEGDRPDPQADSSTN